MKYIYLILGVLIVIFLLNEKETKTIIASADLCPICSECDAERENVRIRGVFSAYTSRAEETDGSPYITADGTDLRGIFSCVVASNDYPFGTVIKIDSIGECVVHDRMNKRYTGQNRIDIYFGNDVKRALEFGRRELYFEIYE